PIQPEIVDKIAASLRRCILFQGVEGTLLNEAARNATLVQVEADEMLVREGQNADAFFVLINGNAKVFLTRSGGKEAAELAIIGPGDTVGEVALLTGKSYAVSVKATVRTVAARFESQFFETMVDRNPAFGLQIARSLGK